MANVMDLHVTLDNDDEVTVEWYNYDHVDIDSAARCVLVKTKDDNIVAVFPLERIVSINQTR